MMQCICINILLNKVMTLKRAVWEVSIVAMRSLSLVGVSNLPSWQLQQCLPALIYSQSNGQVANGVAHHRSQRRLVNLWYRHRCFFCKRLVVNTRWHFKQSKMMTALFFQSRWTGARLVKSAAYVWLNPSWNFLIRCRAVEEKVRKENAEKTSWVKAVLLESARET